MKVGYLISAMLAAVATAAVVALDAVGADGGDQVETRLAEEIHLTSLSFRA